MVRLLLSQVVVERRRRARESFMDASEEEAMVKLINSNSNDSVFGFVRAAEVHLQIRRKY